jgi:hypothetical protein
MPSSSRLQNRPAGVLEPPVNLCGRPRGATALRGAACAKAWSAFYVAVQPNGKLRVHGDMQLLNIANTGSISPQITGGMNERFR